MTKAKSDEGPTTRHSSRADTDGVERKSDARDDEDAATPDPATKPRAARSAPPSPVPSRVVRISGSPSASVKALQVMLADLGFYKDKITGYYGNTTRNAVSALQVKMRDNGTYFSRPHGSFDEPTRQALLNDSSFNVVR